MRAQLSSRDYEQISAYLDGQLGSNEARRFEDLLRARPEMQAALDELGRTRALLRSAGRKRAPRSFAITPAMLGERGPQRPRGFSLNLSPALSFASALATLALVATLLFQLLPGQTSRLTSNAPAAPAPAAAPMLATAPESAAPASAAGAAPSSSAASPTQSAAAKGLVPQAANDQAQPVPPVVTWSGGPAYGMGGSAATGMGGGGATGSGGAAGPGGGSPYLGPLLGPPVASGAANAPVYGLGGGGATGSGGTTLIIPPQAAAGLPAAQSAAPQAQSAAPALSGTGPILGIPAPAEAGQIIEQRSIQGFPSGESGAAPKAAHSQDKGANTNSASAPAPSAADTLLGLPRRLALQILLGAIAVVAGLAAFFVRRGRA